MRMSHRVQIMTEATIYHDDCPKALGEPAPTFRDTGETLQTGFEDTVGYSVGEKTLGHLYACSSCGLNILVVVVPPDPAAASISFEK